MIKFLANSNIRELQYFGFEANPYDWHYHFTEYLSPNILNILFAIGESNGIEALRFPNRTNSDLSFFRRLDKRVFKRNHQSLIAFSRANEFGKCISNRLSIVESLPCKSDVVAHSLLHQ